MGNTRVSEVSRVRVNGVRATTVLAATAAAGLLTLLAPSTALAAAAPASVTPAADHPHHHRHPPWPTCPHGRPRQDYPPRGCHAETDHSSVRAGGEVHVYGAGFRPHESVVVEMPGLADAIETTRANDDGAVVTSVTMPRSADAGVHRLTLTAPGSGNEVVTRIRIRPVAAVSTLHASSDRDDGLPFSGAAAAIPLAGAGLAMVLAGAVTLVNIRRRRLPHPRG